MMEKAYLVLEDGTVFEGSSFGAPPQGMGELVFTTGVCGYIETLTDPGYYGQIVLQTFPLIGNYGMIPEDMEGDCCLKGYVVREWCVNPSNFRQQGTLDAFLREKGIPGICGVDTRQITRILREKGALNAMICSQIPTDLTALKSYRITDAVTQVTRSTAVTFSSDGEARCRVALLDLGTKRDIVRELCRRGCTVTVFPAVASAKEILAGQFDGLVLSNGPGDPAENAGIIAQLRLLLGKLPVFGVGMGHQLTALAADGKTEKLLHGHRGGNQPVRQPETGRTYITSQNHGYVVLPEGLSQGTVSFVNANDGTCEGLDYPEWNAFTVQFYPESGNGPRDTGFLFDRFLTMMGGNR